MMNTAVLFIIALIIFLGVFGFFSFKAFSSTVKEKEKHNAYSFSFTKLHTDEKINLADHKDKVILVVNTASECGYTPQYEGLQKLHEQYASQGLVVIGIPSNDFGGQEPGTNEQIATFCKTNYGVTFPMTEKVNVTGSNMDPFYDWVVEILGPQSKPQWNFHKYLINKDGKVVAHYPSKVSPNAPELVNHIETLIGTFPNDRID